MPNINEKAEMGEKKCDLPIANKPELEIKRSRKNGGCYSNK